MASAKFIQQRIKSVKNTRQITKAMEAVSATKMRRAQRSALDGRPYALAALEMLGNVMQRTEYKPELLAERKVTRVLLAVVTSDKGLAGAFNASVLRKADAWIAEHSPQYPVDIVTVGKKARDYFSGTAVPAQINADDMQTDADRSPRESASSPRNSTFRRNNVVKEFLEFGDYASPTETQPLSNFLLKGFLAHQWDAVEIIYTNFRSTLKQEVVTARVFPVSIEKIKKTIENIIPEHGRFADTITNRSLLTTYYEYKLEPNPEAVLDALIPHLLATQFFHMILESNASEHSARMVAMKSASENAGDIISELTLAYNKSRQANITRELTEITAGREALEG